MAIIYILLILLRWLFFTNWLRIQKLWLSGIGESGNRRRALEDPEIVVVCCVSVKKNQLCSTWISFWKIKKIQQINPYFDKIVGHFTLERHWLAQVIKYYSIIGISEVPKHSPCLFGCCRKNKTIKPCWFILILKPTKNYSVKPFCIEKWSNYI